MRISIVKGNMYCIFVGTTVRGIKNGKCTIPVQLKLAELKVIINADLNGVRVFSFSPTSLETERELDITFEVDE